MRHLPHIHTIQTCEGTACGRCKIDIELCQCNPHRLIYRGVSERITAQGWVPETETKEAA